MAYGLRCWDTNGNLTLDVNGRYTRLVYTNIISSDGSVDLPEIDGHETVQWAEPLDATSISQVVHVTRSGTTISWNVIHLDVTTLILVFMYT